MKHALLFVYIFLLSVSGFAQDSTLHLRDTLRVNLTVYVAEESASPDKMLPGATVELHYKGQVLFSDTATAKGRFKFGVLIDDTSTYVLIVSKKGFAAKSITISPGTDKIPSDTAFDIAMNFRLSRNDGNATGNSNPKPAGRIYYSPESHAFEGEIYH